MSDFDLDRLGDVWRQQPDAAELEALQRAADYVRRRARWAQLVDVVSAIAVAGVVLFLVLSNPQKDTFVVGGAAILVLLFGQQRQRRLRQEELKGLRGNAEEMLDQSIGRVEATIRRTRFSLYTLPPALIFGIAFSYVADADPGEEFIPRFNPDSWMSAAIRVAIVLFVIFSAFYLYRSMLKERDEKERLTRLRDAYRNEREIGTAE